MSRWITADSEAIDSFRYNEASNTLRVRFTSGGQYDYLYTPASVFEALKAAPSKGGFFARHIRDRFLFRKVA